MIKDGGIVGIHGANRPALALLIDFLNLDGLLAFDAEVTGIEHADSDSEPDQEIDCPATVLDFVPPKCVSRTLRIAPALALALLLVTAPGLHPL